MRTDQRPIGVFDSGVGGLTVVAAIRRALPDERIFYLGDLLHLPYGTKSARAVIDFTRAAVRFLVDRDVKMLVIASNAATSIALEVIAGELSIPVIGVIEPGARAAGAATRNKRVGVIGTTRTVESGAYPAALQALDPFVRTFQRATPLLVPLIEEGWMGHPVLRAVLDEYLLPLRERGVDTIVLGCTHYPLISGAVGETMPGVTVVDSAETTARETAAVLREEGLRGGGSGGYRIFLTDFTESFRTVGERILQGTLEEIQTITLRYAEGEIEYR
ncbi:MAG: glutamate racemase [Spirochaetota bacterium]